MKISEYIKWIEDMKAEVVAHGATERKQMYLLIYRVGWEGTDIDNHIVDNWRDPQCKYFDTEESLNEWIEENKKEPKDSQLFKALWAGKIETELFNYCEN